MREEENGNEQKPSGTDRNEAVGMPDAMAIVIVIVVVGCVGCAEIPNEIESENEDPVKFDLDLGGGVNFERGAGRKYKISSAKYLETPFEKEE